MAQPERPIKRAGTNSEYSPEMVLELRRCMNDPIYCIETYMKVQHPTFGPLPFILYDYQKTIIEAVHNNRNVILLTARQQGKTTTVAIYLLWFAMFNRNVTLIIASKDQAHSIEVMDRLKFAYEEMPGWIKPGVKEYNKHSITFDNGAKIQSKATTVKTGRGSSPTKIYLDELAFIDPKIQKGMWSSLLPALSTGGSFIISSTPNGDSDLYARIWREANAGVNSFYPVRVYWDQHPDRGEQYLKDMMIELGEQMCRQEVLCEFLSSDALLIDTMRLAEIKTKEPATVNEGLKLWEPLKSARGTIYLVGVDVATGGGGDFSVIQIVEFPTMVQVGEWRDNKLNIPALYARVKRILIMLTKPDPNGQRAEVFWTFERNGVGEGVAALYHNDEIPPPGEIVSDEKFHGLQTTGKNKILSCLQLKTMVEKRREGLVVNSPTLKYELENFVASGGSYAAKAGATDDCVTAMLLIVRLIKYLSGYDERAFQKIYAYEDTDPSEDEPLPFLVGGGW